MVLVLAAGALVLATAGLFLRVELVLSWYFHLAWWSYIILADALNRRLHGHSLLRDRPREFLWLCAVSVAWWTLFEGLNLRLGNWYYVMDHPARGVRWAAGVLAFATVLPGILETVTLLEGLGVLRSVRTAPLVWGLGKERAVLALGAACLVLPLGWPDVFFPLTWGSFVFLLEPWNRRHARASFLRDLTAGEAGPFCRTLLAGLVCGLLWETWNFWARTKWMYTVPGFEDWKLFEMPLLGFLGFPPFAVECVVVVRFLEAWRQRAHRRVRILAGPLGAVATLLVFAAADPVTVDSVYVPLRTLPGLPPGTGEALAGQGLSSPEKLVHALADEQGLARWAVRTGRSPDELRQARDHALLVLHRGLGAQRAAQLVRLGVRRREDLAGRDPAALAQAIRGLGEPRPADRFLERRARVWTAGLAPVRGTTSR